MAEQGQPTDACGMRGVLLLRYGPGASYFPSVQGILVGSTYGLGPRHYCVKISWPWVSRHRLRRKNATRALRRMRSAVRFPSREVVNENRPPNWGRVYQRLKHGIGRVKLRTPCAKHQWRAGAPGKCCGLIMLAEAGRLKKFRYKRIDREAGGLCPTGQRYKTTIKSLNDDIQRSRCASCHVVRGYCHCLCRIERMWWG